MIFGEYYSSMDRDYGALEPSDIPPEPGMPVDKSKLGPQELGAGTNPMTNQVQAFSARIKEGAGKIEFEFLGQGKTNSQQPGPEAFGKTEREDMRALAEINDIKTSTHAAFHTGSLAGLGREGFNEQIRQQALSEIGKAIEFAAEATRGGAVVFHTGEWNRPMTDVRGNFEAYPNEKEKTPIMVVDDQTGDLTAVRRDQEVYEPKFFTAAEYEKQIERKLVGTIDLRGNKIEANDWVDIKGNAIKREWIISEKPEEVEKLFDRVPVWNKDKTNFDVERRTFDYFINEAELLSKRIGTTIAPEVLFVKSQLADQVSQSKGGSLFYAQSYDQHKKNRDVAVKALEFYEKLEKSIPLEEQWKIMQQIPGLHGLTPNENKLPSELLNDIIKSSEDSMRHIHESSASSDARAQQAMDRMNRVKTVEDFGLSKTAETIGTLGVKALKYSESHEKELSEPIYLAPENFDSHQFGSHPDEIREIVTAARKNMQAQLEKEGYDPEAAKEKSKQHIKATLDIGHFNTWRQHFKANEHETPEERDKRFNKWLLNETEKLAKDGILGHVHLSDNFGYDDEHLSPGQGNVPMKEFIKKMEDAGLKDFIVETGSFNAMTSMPDTWALMGSPVYSTNKGPSFRSLHQQHFGYHNSANYIVGAYAPSNEWRLWSEVPLE